MNQNNKNQKRLTKLILDNCVHINLPYDSEYINLYKEWCREKFDLERPHHPIFEAEEGWIDYFEGDWAYTYDVVIYLGSHFKWLFWFANKNDLLEFKLTWIL